MDLLCLCFALRTMLIFRKALTHLKAIFWKLTFLYLIEDSIFKWHLQPFVINTKPLTSRNHYSCCDTFSLPKKSNLHFGPSLKYCQNTLLQILCFYTPVTKSPILSESLSIYCKQTLSEAKKQHVIEWHVVSHTTPLISPPPCSIILLQNLNQSTVKAS